VRTEHLGDARAISHAGLYEHRVLCHGVPMTAGQVVDDHQVVLCTAKGDDHVRADVPGATGNQTRIASEDSTQTRATHREPPSA
jgi:hypothetical protein